LCSRAEGSPHWCPLTDHPSIGPKHQSPFGSLPCLGRPFAPPFSVPWAHPPWRQHLPFQRCLSELNSPRPFIRAASECWIFFPNLKMFFRSPSSMVTWLSLHQGFSRLFFSSEVGIIRVLSRAGTRFPSPTVKRRAPPQLFLFFLLDGRPNGRLSFIPFPLSGSISFLFFPPIVLLRS